MSHDVPYEGEEYDNFMENMTLLENRLSFHQNRQIFAYVQSPQNQEDLNHSLKLIETESEPDLVSHSDMSFSPEQEMASVQSLVNQSLPVPLETGELSNDDSFMRVEQMLDELNTPFQRKIEKLDTTLEVVEYILQHRPEQKPSSEEIELQKIGVNNKEQCNIPEKFKARQKSLKLECNNPIFLYTPSFTPEKDSVNNKEECNVPEKFKACQKSLKLECNNPISPYTPSFTPQKDTEPDEEFVTSTDHQNQKHRLPISKTPSNVAPKNQFQKHRLPIPKTPSNVAPKNQFQKHRLPIPKTPSNVSPKNQFGSATKWIPLKTNAYQHIASPVAAYIKNSPQVPLVQDVRPKKPLPGPSFIPKLVKSGSQSSLTNKENCILPCVAYRSAKNTQTLVAPCKERLPECQFAKNLGSSLSPAVVIKHNYRETSVIKKDLHSGQEDSFADLSLHQADLSVCTQKSAFPQPKKPLN